MQLVEQHVIARTDSRYEAIDAAALASKNLYNQATYQIRQAYIHEGQYLPYAEIFHRVKHLECYGALPAKVSNSILILIHKNWVSFFRAVEGWKEHPEKFTGRPRIPGYKPKEKGRNILIYDKQAIGKRVFKKTGKIVPSGVGIELETQVRWEDLDGVRIVPRGSSYVVEVVHRAEIKQAVVDPLLIAAIDLGVDQLATITSNKPGFQPRLYNGRPLKDLNHYYNQQRAHHQKHLAKQNRKTSRKLERITTKRNRRVKAYLHTASRRMDERHPYRFLLPHLLCYTIWEEPGSGEIALAHLYDLEGVKTLYFDRERWHKVRKYSDEVEPWKSIKHVEALRYDLNGPFDYHAMRYLGWQSASCGQQERLGQCYSSLQGVLPWLGEHRIFPNFLSPEGGPWCPSDGDGTQCPCCAGRVGSSRPVQVLTDDPAGS